MLDFVESLNPWLTAGLLAVALAAAWAIGWWRGDIDGKRLREPATGKMTDSIMALMGLLLAFTFGISLEKHNQRRLMVVGDSNAIGDFYTCVNLLPDSAEREALRGEVRGYVEHRLAVVQGSMDEETLQKRLDEAEQNHGRMESLTRKAVSSSPPVTVPLVNKLTDLTSNHAARLAAGRDRLPWSIVGLLVLTAVTSLAMLGYQQGAEGKRSVGAVLGFVLLVSLVVGVTLDLNQPRSGLITVSQEPLERLLATMKK